MGMWECGTGASAYIIHALAFLQIGPRQWEALKSESGNYTTGLGWRGFGRTKKLTIDSQFAPRQADRRINTVSAD